MNMAESSAARLQMLINRAQRLNTEAARPQVVENQDDDDFLSGFQHFRRSHESRRAGSSRKKKKPMYSFKVTCLDSPEYQTINPTIVKAMNEKQLGYRPIKIERSATINKLTEKVMSIFKFTCAFKYMKAVRNTINICELKELQVTSTKDVKSKIGRSNLYILPAEKIGQSSPEESSDESGSSLPNPHLDAIPQRRSRLGHRNNDFTDEDMLPPITVPVRQRLDLSTVAGAPNAVNNQDPPQVSQNNSAGTRSTLSTSRRRRLSTPRRPRRSTAIRSGTQEQENNAELNQSSIIDVTEGTPPVSQNNSAGTRSTLSTPRRRRLSTPRRPRRSTAIRSGTQEQENNAELNQSSIIDVTEETPPEVVAAGYRTATGDSPTVLFRTSAPLMVDQMNTHSISIPNQTNRSQQIIDITRGLHVNETNDNGLNDYIPETAPFGDVGQNPSADGLKDVLVEHRELFIKSTSEEDPLLMEVRRGYVLVDSITIIRFSGDDLHSPLSIKFVDEEGVDLGGLRREFWSLLLHNISHSCYVTGKPGRQTFQSNYLEKKKKTFFHLGQLIALSIIQDGPGLPIFSDIVTDYIINGQTSVINPDDLPDGLKDALEKMQNSASDRDAKEAYSSIMDIATDIGFIVPITSFTKKHVKPLQAAFIESQISSCKDELNQFIEGLDTHQVMSLLRQPENRASARSLFSGRVKPITVGKFRKLLKFKYAEGNANQDQRATGIGFLTFLQATKGRATEINGIKLELKDVMMWLTGSTIIPAIGFHKLIDVDFADSTFVNTCALALTLKTQPDLSSEDAVSYYTELIINSQTFTKE